MFNHNAHNHLHFTLFCNWHHETHLVPQLFFTCFFFILYLCYTSVWHTDKVACIKDCHILWTSPFHVPNFEDTSKGPLIGQCTSWQQQEVLSLVFNAWLQSTWVWDGTLCVFPTDSLLLLWLAFVTHICKAHANIQKVFCIFTSLLDILLPLRN